MKIKSKRKEFEYFRMNKIIRIMKISVFLVLIAITNVYANGSYSQDKKLSLKMTDVKLGDVLDEIENKSEFRFLANQKMIDMERAVSINVIDTKISAILGELFEDTSIIYTLEDRQIVLTSRILEKTNTNFKRGVTQSVLSPSLEAVFLTTNNNVFATVKGMVTDANGTPVPGANVLVKGTTIGTQTDFDGGYTIEVPEGSNILVFSYVGLVNQEVEINGQTVINVTMQEDTTVLDEIVLVGYGTQNKQEVTGAVAVADLDTYNVVPTNNVLDLVKGTIPGLNIAGINKAGEVPDFTIRGANTIAGNAAPLLVVDGVIYPGTLGEIRNADIASFTTLKDASAAAIYGARSANGVILIETKKGKGKIDGKPKYSVSINTSVSNELERFKLYSGQGYLQSVLDIRESNGLEADPTKIDQYLLEIESANYLATPDHASTLPDPFSISSQSAYLTSADFSVQNRTERSNYYISAGITDQQGVILNDNFRQLSLRINHNSKLTDWLSLGVTSFYTSNNFSGSEPDLLRNSYLSPYASIYDEDGKIIDFPQSTSSAPNPLLGLAQDHEDLRHFLRGSANLTIDIPWIPGLKFKSTLSHRKTWSEFNVFYGPESDRGRPTNGDAERKFDRSDYQLFDNMITYNRTFADKHKIGFTLLYSQEDYESQGFTATGKGYTNHRLGFHGLANAEIQTTEGRAEASKAFGKMARFNYTYSNKYSFTGTFRRDGYSAFAVNKKWANFASVGANWNVGEEAFIQDIETISHLNMSLSYGSVGNRSIDRYETLASLGTNKYIYGNSTSFVVTQDINGFANPDLGWEKTTGFNGGIGFGLFNERISGRLDWYSNTTTDLLFTRELPDISGGPGEIVTNLGKLENTGIEFSLKSINIQNENFQWTSTFNFSRNRNKVKTILGNDGDGDGIEDDLPDAREDKGIFIDRDLGAIYDYNVIGIWQQADVDNGSIIAGRFPGDYKTEDINGDGLITSDDDRKILGTSLPNFRWSLTNIINYKKFSLFTYMYSVWGGNGYYLSGNNTPYFNFGANAASINAPVYDYWTPTNTGALYPRPAYKVNGKSKAYVDRSFIKLQKVALSYDLSDIVERFGISGMSLTFSANNLFTYAPHWDGLDPETNQGLNEVSRPSIRDYSLAVLFNF